MQKNNNYNISEDLWLECEKIKESISFVLQKLHDLPNTEIAFSTLLEEIQQRIVSQTTAISQSIQSLLDTQTSTLQQSLSSLNSAISSNSNNIAQIIQEVTTLQSSVSAAQNAILQAIENLQPEDNNEPFILNFDEVYATSSEYYSPRTHYATNTLYLSPKEPFVIDYNTPSYILVEFDVTLDISIVADISFYINDALASTKNISLVSGLNHIIHQFALNNLSQSDNEVSFTISTVATSSKTIENLHYTLVGNNALFLREMPQNVYYCWPVENRFYITKRNKNVCEYKEISMANIDFSGNYTPLATLSSTSTIYPLVILTCTASSASFNQLCYLQISEVTGKATTHTLDGTQQRSLDLAYSGENPRNVDAFPCYDGSYTAQFVLLYKREARLRRYRAYNVVRTTSLSHNYTSEFIPVQTQSPIMCTIKNGYVSTYSDYVLYQNSHGEWYVSTMAKLSQGMPGFLLGFGTRANFSICPPLSQNSNSNYIYMRAFIKAYNSWRAYYFYLDKNEGTFTMQKVQEITGTFDQIVGVNGNLYFGINNGSFTSFYDPMYKSITEF